MRDETNAAVPLGSLAPRPSALAPRVKILDFGLARTSSGEANLTQSGAIVGTPAYMAPEQAQGKAVDPRSDLFSLGCVLYRMAAGDNPFRGNDIISTLMAIATENPAPPVSLNLELPTELSDLIMRLLAKKPSERPESAQAVAEVLGRIAHDEQQPKAKVDSPQKKAKVATSRADPVRGRNGRRIAVAVLALALLVPLGYWLYGIIVSISTPDGVLLVEVTEPNAEILVNGKNVVVRWDEGRQKAEIRIKPGTQKVEVKVMKDGFKIVSENVNLERNGRTIFNAKLIPNPSTPMRTETALPATYKNSLGMEFVLVPKGKSWLGGGGGRFGDQEVEMPQDFYLGKYEVTQEEWQKVTGTNPSHFSRDEPGWDAVKAIPDAELKRFPVEMVSWEDAQLFVKLLNIQVKEAGWMYRLPKEAEWEYACRGGPLADRFDSAFDFYFEKPMNQLQAGQANFEHGKGLKRTCKANFHLRVEVLVPDGVGSVFFRWAVTGQPGPFELPVTTTGRWQTGSLTRKTIRVVECPLWSLHEVAPAAAPANTWVTMEALAIDDHVTIKVNGVTTADVRQADGQRSGYISLLTGSRTGVRFRKIEIKELSPTKTKGAIAPRYKNSLDMEFVMVPKGKSWLGGGNGKEGTIRVWNPDWERAKQVIALGPANQRLVMDLDRSGKYVVAAGYGPLIYVLRLPAQEVQGGPEKTTTASK